MVEVAVIGAGAAGLVAAKNLIKSGMHICVFERRKRLAGAWSTQAPSSEPTSFPQMWETLTPNLSRYTCMFSDFPWEDRAPLYPSLSQMNEYLESYAQAYVLGQELCTMHYGCEVTNVQQTGKDSHPYSVHWNDDSGNAQSKAFDGVVVASGFFAGPRLPPGVNVSSVSCEPSSRRILHSSSYRSPKEFTNQSVAVIGGSFSAHELACDLRKHCREVVNVFGNQTAYVLPRHVPTPNGGFLPLDCVLYQRQSPAPQTETTYLDKDARRKRHEYLRNLIGLRKLEQATRMGWTTPSWDDIPLASISDDYLDMVIDEKIKVIPGRLETVSETGAGLQLSLENGSMIKDIDSVILCTGYETSLEFLSPEILEVLEYDKKDTFAPITLCHETFHPRLPRLGFVGLYKGAYFGALELQARLVTGLVSGSMEPPTEIMLAEELEKSRQIREKQPRAPFPRFDYIGFMDSLAKYQNLVPDSHTYGSKGAMVTPAFYQPSLKIAERTKSELESLHASQRINIAQAALSALVGKWSFERSISDKLTSSSQRVYGQIAYSLQEPEMNSLRYREDGFLDINGNQLEVFREYDYLVNRDILEIYFVEEGKRAHLFLSLKFETQTDDVWVATSDHLCIKDLYKGTIMIRFDGLGATDVTMYYRVKGPKKDYESTTKLRPIV